MKNVICVMAVLLMGYQAQAQEGDEIIVRTLPAAPKKKRVIQFNEATNEVVEVTSNEEPAPEASGTPIYIMNKQQYQGYQGNSQRQVQEQPTTIVEAAPLKESSAENMRRKRQDMETRTEQKIVEKLEEARMEDERARADRLFGQGFGSGRTAETYPTSTPAPQPVPVQVVQPTMVQAVAAPEPTPEVDIRSEIREAMKEVKVEEGPKTNYFVSGQVGLGEYPDVSNVRGNVASGFSLGMVTPERIVAEGTFLYSEYEIEMVQPGYATPYPPFKDMTQYNFEAALKYQLLPGKIRPYLGALAGYTYRKYTGRQQYPYGYGYSNYNNGDVSTNAFDVGFTAGLDLQLTDSFALGGDFRYRTNVANRSDTAYQSSFVNPPVGTPVEELDYYTFVLSGKFTF